MSTAKAVLSATENRSLGDDLAASATRKAGWLILVGALIAALACFWHVDRFWPAYLVAFVYVLSISLGALFFVIVQHLVRAGWSVAVRRVAEGLAWNVRFLWLLFLPLVWGIAQGHLMPVAGLHWAEHHGAAAAHGDPTSGGKLHGAAEGEGPHRSEAEPHPEALQGTGSLEGPASPWSEGPHLEGVAHGALSAGKEAWLSFPWVMARMVIYFVIWIGLAWYYRKTSIAQDTDPDPKYTLRMARFSAPAMILYALSTSLVGFDLLMALDPYWFSTIFGVYFFAGCFLSAMASIILVLTLLQRNGRLTESVTPEHFHDVGKFMFAFVVFWAYIAFSQYMLIWYANIPEETGWFLIRQTGDWKWIGVTLILGHFALPFFLLLSRFPKRRPGLLVVGAIYILAVHFVDLFWIVQPQKSPLGHMPVPLLDVFLCVAMIGLYVVFTAKSLQGAALIPTGDPRLAESLSHENY